MRVLAAFLAALVSMYALAVPAQAIHAGVDVGFDATDLEPVQCEWGELSVYCMRCNYYGDCNMCIVQTPIVPGLSAFGPEVLWGLGLCVWIPCPTEVCFALYAGAPEVPRPPLVVV